MASTRTYLDYLNDKVEIAPANSQEELEASQLLESLMAEHGLETHVQEFSAPGAGKIAYAVVYVLLFLGMLLSGFLGTPVAIAGFVLVLLAVGLLALRFGGRDLLSGVGPRANSQNVIGVHHASGPLVMKGNRPIVIVAHYDTPYESLLARPQFANYRAAIKRASFWTVAVVAVCALLQLFGFVPAVARHVFWVIGVLAAVPTLLLGVDAFYERFAECTLGANNNKASLAAMLGVMDVVRPAEDEAKRYVATRPAPVEPAESEEFAGDDAEEVVEPATEPGGEEPASEPVEGGSSVAAEGDDASAVGAAAGLGGAIAAATGAFDKVRDGVMGLIHRRGADDVKIPFGPNEDESAANQIPLDGEPTFEGLPENEGVFDAETEAMPEEDEAFEPELEPEDAAEVAPEPVMFEEEAPVVVAEPEVAPAPAPEPAAEPRCVILPPVNAVPLEAYDHAVRRGADFIESLHMLPENCEIIYQIPPRPAIDLSTLPEVPEMPQFSPQDFMVEVAPMDEPEPEPEPARTGYVPSFFSQEIPYIPVESQLEAEETVEQPQAEEYEGEWGTYEQGYDDLDIVPSIPTVQEILDSVPVAEYEVIEDEPAAPADESQEPEPAVEYAQAEYEQAEYENNVSLEGDPEVVPLPVMSVPEVPVVADASLPLTEDAAYPEDLPVIEVEEDAAEAVASPAATVETPALTDEVLAEDEDEAPEGEPGAFEYDEDDDFDEPEASQTFGERVKNFFEGLRERFVGNKDPELELAEDEYDEPEDPQEFEEAFAEETPAQQELQEGVVEGSTDEDSQLGESDVVSAEETVISEPLVVEPKAEQEPEAVEPASAPEELTEGGHDEKDIALDAEYEEAEDAHSASPEATLVDVMSTMRFAPNEVASDEEVERKDTTGLQTLSEDGSIAPPAEVQPTPAAIDDPSWGKSEFKPKPSNIARRAVLFDLPDPSVISRDPLADLDTTDPTGRVIASSEGTAEREAIGVVSGSTMAPASAALPKRRGLFGRSQESEEESMGEWLGVGDDFDAKADGRRIGSWNNFDNDGDGSSRRDGGWKGGATTRSDLRVVDGDSRAEMEELRSAILDMSEEELLSHDIYFVALGGSTLNHAGMREFLADFRKTIRGAFLVNLDSVGAGQLTVLTVEGSSNTRRADRRLVRLISNVAKDLHIGLGHKKYDWAETDATPAMQAAVRAVTIMGMDQDGTPALSGSLDDTPQNVDPAQVVDVTELVTELIRRA